LTAVAPAADWTDDGIDDVWVDCLEQVRFHSVARGQADGARYCERGRDRAATYQ
jgi:hypothetical protein